MDSNTVQWCNLPKDLVLMVARRLGTCTDIRRLRAVCSPWRSSFPPSPNNSPLFSVKFPFPIAPNPDDDLNPKCLGSHFSLTESTIFYIQPCSFENPNNSNSQGGWMLKLEDTKLGKVRLLYPFSKYKYEGWLKLSQKVYNMLNIRVLEVKKICNLQLFDSNFNELDSNCVKKVVMSSIPLSNVDYYAILILHTGGKLGYFKFGGSNWTMIDNGEGNSCYDDILHHGGKFYAVNNNGKMIVIDSSLNLRVIESPLLRDGPPPDVKYKLSLVESNGNLYLVEKFTDWYYYTYSCDSDEDDFLNSETIIKFKIYKLNDEEQDWVQVTSLGEESFFLGDDCCFSVSASQFSCCKSNCIYFTDHEYVKEDRDHLGHDVGIFSLDEDNSERIAYYFGCSRLFWPPPTWLKRDVTSKPSSSSGSRHGKGKFHRRRF